MLCKRWKGTNKHGHKQIQIFLKVRLSETTNQNISFIKLHCFYNLLFKSETENKIPISLETCLI